MEYRQTAATFGDITTKRIEARTAISSFYDRAVDYGMKAIAFTEHDKP